MNFARVAFWVKRWLSSGTLVACSWSKAEEESSANRVALRVLQSMHRGLSRAYMRRRSEAYTFAIAKAAAPSQTAAFHPTYDVINKILPHERRPLTSREAFSSLRASAASSTFFLA